MMVRCKVFLPQLLSRFSSLIKFTSYDILQVVSMLNEEASDRSTVTSLLSSLNIYCGRGFQGSK